MKAALTVAENLQFWRNFCGEAWLSVSEALAKVDQRMDRVVQLRYFAGSSDAEIASALDVGDRTVRRDWEHARLLLAKALK